MKSIAVTDLTDGIEFTEPVYFDGNNLFAAANVAVKAKDIDRLVKWGIETVSTEGVIKVPANPSASVVTDERTNDASVSQSSANNAQSSAMNAQSSANSSDDGLATDANQPTVLDISRNDPVQKEISVRYAKLSNELRETFEIVEKKDKVDSRNLDHVVDQLSVMLNERQNDVVQFILFGLQGECGLVENALNAGALAWMVAQALGIVRHKAMQLVTACLLRDVGMLRIPKSILEKRAALSPEELQYIKTHPIHSSKIITREFRLAEEVALAALQHHERWDGDGYPKGISGKAISLSARIIAVCDAFEAMVSQRPYRNSMIGYTAIRNVLADNGRRFDPDILRAFIKTMGIYPVGSIVLLNNASVGRIVANHPDSPLRPQVKVMVDEAGEVYYADDGPIVDLTTERRLFVARAVNPREIGPRTAQSLAV